VEIAPGVTCGGDDLLVIAGTCVIESAESAMRHATALARIARELALPLVFKASFDKANRTSIDSFRGPGIERGLEALELVKRETELPVLSDVHIPEQCARAAEVLDVLQIPAFLCRQTDLLVAAAATGRVVNVKKGQFLSPWDAAPIVEKLRRSGAGRILLTERGTSFGYRTLVNDMRSIPIMRDLGVPVVFDATHSVQRPGGLGQASGGDPQFIPTLAASAVAAGADALFFEVHEDPARALSDGPNALRLEFLPDLLAELKALHEIVRPTRSSPGIDR
jgi:2-dehydro-3-deoxyphosphooctonate aldolase (KDO 8-P synthase)